ncbi:MAG: hypothetical protein VR64_21075 [Desulfatitalea sp. BRH_c12]|nr:MAG: hypothetical protein VR64_21075 [Desulfatitalea sp. BRH_c12]
MMHIARLFLLAFLLITGPGCAGGGADPGPLQVQNRFPLHLLFLTPRPASALTPPAGGWRAALAIDYSSIYVDESSRQWNFLADMETAVVDLSVVYGLSNRAAIRLDMPLVHMGGGFLDSFLESYHDALGVSNYGRENRPKDSFAYRIDREGSLWFEGESGGLHLADITISGQWTIFPSIAGYHAYSSMLVSLKVPTGDSRHGYGSGRWDAGVFLPTEWRRNQWSLYAMPGFMWHSDPDTRGADVSARNAFSMFVGAAYAYSEQWHWMAQLNYFSSPIEKTGVALVDDGAYELALGFRRTLNDAWHLEFAFCEDIFTKAAPDFSLHLGVVWTRADLDFDRR